MRVTNRSIFAALVFLGTSSSVRSANHNSLDWQKADGYRVAKLPVPASGKSGFSLLPAHTTGIIFTNTLPETRAMTNANLMNGSGVALGDYDGDGLCDIYLCNLNGTNALYKKSTWGIGSSKT